MSVAAVVVVRSGSAVHVVAIGIVCATATATAALSLLLDNMIEHKRVMKKRPMVEAGNARY